MLNIRKILFPTDFSDCAERTFTYAAEIAALCNAEIHAFHARIRQKDEYPALQHLLDDEEDVEENPALPAEHLFDLPNVNHDLVIQADATDSSACNAILNYTEKNNIDLIVMGSHGRRGPKRLFLGSTAECVIRNTDCPVLTLRSDAETMDSGSFKRIIVPIDFSAYSEEALHYANEFARLSNAKITLVHAIEEAIIPTVYGVEAMTFTTMKPIQDKSDNALKELLESQISPSFRAGVQTLIGPPASVIAEYASEQEADLIILASHGLTGFKRFLLGSVAESLNRRAPCAVLTVKTFGKSLLTDAETSTEEAA